MHIYIHLNQLFGAAYFFCAIGKRSQPLSQIGKKENLFYIQICVSMASEHKFRWSQMTCSNVKVVSWTFHWKFKKSVNQLVEESERRWQAKWEKLSYKPKMLFHLNIGFYDVRSQCCAKKLNSKRVLFITYRRFVNLQRCP